MSRINWRIVRRWVYWVLVAAGALATFYGLLPPEAIPLYAGLALAALNTRPPAIPGDNEED